MTASMTPYDLRAELRGISKRFGDFTALAPLDLAVRGGEFIALLGPAGSGKTTALRILAGLEPSSAGMVLINRFEVTPMPPQRRDVAFTFHSPALYPHMSVERNIAFPLRAQRIAANARIRRVSEVMERLGLQHLRRRKPRRLSPQERQLVSLARAMVRDARLCLYDEPLAVFEGERRQHMRRELRAIHQELRATTVMATRDPLDAMTTADRIVIMNEGRVVQCDVPQALHDSPADLFVAQLLGARSMSFLEATCADGMAQLPEAGLCFHVDDRGAKPVDPQRVMLCIPAAQVRIDPQGIAAAATRSAVASGSEAGLIHLRLGKVALKMHAPPGEPPADGETIRIHVNLTGCRWFDAISGKALPWEARHLRSEDR